MSPDNTDSPTVSSEQPQQLTSTYNPFGAASPELPSTIAPIEPQPIPQPAKKSRKELIIGLIITAVVVVASAVGVTSFVNNQTTQAKAAAFQYRKDVLVQLNAVTNVDNYKNRVAIWRNTVKLKDVQFGASLSKEYKDALNLKSRYESLITDSYPTILDRYASTDLSPFLKDLQTALVAKLPAPANITDSSTLAANKQYVTALKLKTDTFQTLATRARTYVYPQKYRDSQSGVVKALENMSSSYDSMASAYTVYIDEAENFLSLKAKGDTNGLHQLETSMAASQKQEQAIIAKIEQDYPQYTKDLTTNESSLAKSMIADGWFDNSKENVLKVGEKLDLMREELK